MGDGDRRHFLGRLPRGTLYLLWSSSSSMRGGTIRRPLSFLWWDHCWSGVAVGDHKSCGRGRAAGSSSGGGVGESGEGRFVCASPWGLVSGRGIGGQVHLWVGCSVPSHIGGRDYGCHGACDLAHCCRRGR